MDETFKTVVDDNPENIPEEKLVVEETKVMNEDFNNIIENKHEYNKFDGLKNKEKTMEESELTDIEKKRLQFEGVRYHCGKHSTFAMSKMLNINKDFLLKNNIVSLDKTKKCIFCVNSNKVLRKRSHKVSQGIDLIKKQCGIHSIPAMARVLNIGPRNFQRIIKEESIIFSEIDTENCHFCKHNEKVLNLGEEIIQTLKNHCRIHRIQAVCNHSNVNKLIAERWLKEQKSKLPKTTYCVICDQKKAERKCPMCNNIFEMQKELNHHIITVHDGKKPFQCKTCLAFCSTETNLVLHEEKKHKNPEKKIECNICKRIFSFTYLKYHMKTFHNTRKQDFLCTKCPAKFYNKSQLTIHFDAVHEGKKLYKCSNCNMSFAHNHGLKGHMSAVHEKKKPHLCPTCGVSFADKGNLTKHIAAVHKGIKRDQWKTGKNKLSLIANQ